MRFYPSTRFLSVFLFFSVLILGASPKLRLTNTAVGPVSIAVGANGATQVVEAFNAGDGTLAPVLSALVPWIAPTVGAQRACTMRAGSCIPLQIGFQTASLTAGMYTGTVTVNDPNAVDAPQTITVTVQIGGGVPDKLTLYVPPNGSSDTTIVTNSAAIPRVTTQDGGKWLFIALEGTGSFRFTYPFRIRAIDLPGMAEGAYNGSIMMTGSTFAPDNKTIAVTMQVTSQPIARVSPENIRLRLAPNAPKQTINAGVTNIGQGGLVVTGATGTTSSGGNSWLAVGPVGAGPVVPVTIDQTGLAPGIYQGTISIASNAVNGPVTVPVELQVIAASAPVAAFQGVVDNATFSAGDAVAAGDIVAVFGDQFSSGAPATGTQLPLVTTLGGVRVLVNNQPAPLYYTSFGQVNFQIPYETPPGSAEVRVERDGQLGNAVSVDVASRAPRLLRLNIGEYGIIVNQDGTFPIPAATASAAGLNGHPAQPGDALTIYAIGLGPVSPAVMTGAAAPSVEPFARVDPTPAVTFNGGFSGFPVVTTPFFAGLTPGFVGLYQINVVIPPEVPSSDHTPIQISVENVQSNVVQIAVAAP